MPRLPVALQGHVHLRRVVEHHGRVIPWVRFSCRFDRETLSIQEAEGDELKQGTLSVVGIARLDLLHLSCNPTGVDREHALERIRNRVELVRRKGVSPLPKCLQRPIRVALKPSQAELLDETREQALILELCTHNPRNKGSTIDLYTTFPWASLCEEVAKLKLVRRKRGEVVALRRAAVAGGDDDDEGGPDQGSDPSDNSSEPHEQDSGLATRLATREPNSSDLQLQNRWRRRESNPGPKVIDQRRYVRSSRFVVIASARPRAGSPGDQPILLSRRSPISAARRPAHS